VQELYRCAGTQFDPTVVEALVSIIKNRASESRVAESS
jgi:HD-GYP domain-containing protein (c-di-GMP phosphodiesterase class II)